MLPLTTHIGYVIRAVVFMLINFLSLVKYLICIFTNYANCRFTVGLCHLHSVPFPIPTQWENQKIGANAYDY